jgi:hypothetical protein
MVPELIVLDIGVSFALTVALRPPRSQPKVTRRRLAA